MIRTKKYMQLSGLNLILILIFIILVFKWKKIFYYNATLLALVVSILFLIFSVKSRKEKYAQTFAYISFSFMAVTSLAIFKKAHNFYLIVFTFFLLLTAYQILLYINWRFGKMSYIDEFYIIFLSAVGFWFIIKKFYYLGVISLLLGINTALLIGFLSYYLIEEEQKI